ncbi:DUF4179 domain-containing protein [Peptoniphilus harei]|uniref:DUF4179 domain-containing protein n=1 Tax=Peptoniphilus harei TaxID=54005 RepID=A0A2X1ZXX4_9FIRM|nr:DUF4179 domain-containing protein [Peptoniphilus harei]MDU6098400.1 DUF4179 domain-containing protein [Peptoniphilus harei]QQT90670.1 DUF4179 domain-containing protein [Peptoniphilus harei]SPY48246.1 Uncharacterised protein [Peptoniphilus harei]
MKNNIYDELNDMKIEYEEVPLNDFERENLKRTVRSLKIKNKKNKFNKKIVTIAASLILVLGITNYTSGGYVFAKTRELASNFKITLSDAMGLSREVDEYSVNLNEVFEINGKKYIFDKFIIEDNNLYTVILSLNDSEKMLSGEVNLTELKVNGKKIKIFGSSGSGYTLPEDEKVNVYTLKYVLEDSLPKEGEVNLEFFFDEFLGNKKKINLSTNIDMSQMQMNKKLIAKDFTIPNTNNIVIESFTTSPASQKILLTYPDIEDGYLYSIKARDSKDRFVYFETGEAEKNKSNLYFSPVTSKVTADELLNEIKTLKCQLYRVTVHSYDNREIPTGEQAIGDEFTLTLK